VGGLEAKDRIIVALDVPRIEQARAIVRELKDHVGGFKVGLELLTAAGSRDVVRMVHGEGAKVFYDGKFHDIPHTMAGTARAVGELDVWMFNVHASAGEDGIRAAVGSACNSLVLAVTVLTSLDEGRTRRIYGSPPDEVVCTLAGQAFLAYAHGIVCSPRELVLLRGMDWANGLMKVTPGVRPAWAAADDQKWVTTPGEAVQAGADYLVIGRPILKPPPEISGRVDAAGRIAREIEEALG
jgi:orotidine-5'-phosphate decarboxylase